MGELTISEVWAIFLTVSGAVTTVLVLQNQLRNWKKNSDEARAERRKRERREETLDSLVASAENIHALMKHMKDLSKCSPMIHDIKHAQEELIKQNAKQDESIAESLEERGLQMRALRGLLDKAIKDGANGTAHSARAELEEYLNKRAHKHDRKG